MFPSRLLKKADEIAETSDCQHKLACILTDKRGKIISYSSNLRKTHPLMKQIAKKVNQNKKITLHAEIAALVKARRQPHTAYILRKMKKGGYGLAKPCSICSAALEEAGVERVVFTTNYGGFCSMEI